MMTLGTNYATDEEIVQQVSRSEPSDEEEEEEDEITIDSVVTNGEAADMFEKCLRWYEQQQEATPTALMVLKGARDLACKKRLNNLKQSTLGYFIQKQADR